LRQLYSVNSLPVWPKVVSFVPGIHTNAKPTADSSLPARGEVSHAIRFIILTVYQS
jgi:hypothetical protein